MVNKYILAIVLIFFGLMIVSKEASAHQPRIVPIDAAVMQVNNPEVSQAFYGELRNRPQFFEINSDKDFTFYINILLPKIPDIDKNITLAIYRGEGDSATIIDSLNGVNYGWKEFYEPFGNDYYWQGPEFKKQVQPGKYIILVSNPKNEGKYSLAIGEQEKFPPKEILNTIYLMPTLQKDFFGKPLYMAFYNFVGLFIGLVILVVVGIPIVIIFLIKMVQKKKDKAMLKQEINYRSKS